MPGIIAGTVGGVVAILTAIAFIISYLVYNRYAQAVYQSNGSDATSVPEPSHVSKEKMSIQSTYSVPQNTLLDPPPNYSSLM